MEFRNDKVIPFILIAIAIGANVFIPFQLMPIEKKAIFPLIGFLFFLDLLALYLGLQSTVIKIDTNEILLKRNYRIKWIKSEETRISLGSITEIKRVRGNRGGPVYSIYFMKNVDKLDKVTITSWDIEDPRVMAEALSKRTKISITNSWFF